MLLSICPGFAANLPLIIRRARCARSHLRQGGEYESAQCVQHVCTDGLGSRPAAEQRRWSTEVDQGATRGDLDVRLLYNQTSGRQSRVGHQSKRAADLHRERLLLVANCALRPSEICVE